MDLSQLFGNGLTYNGGPQVQPGTNFGPVGYTTPAPVNLSRAVQGGGIIGPSVQGVQNQNQNQQPSRPFVPSVANGSTKEEIAAYQNSQDPFAQMRDQINSGYDNYFNQLDSILDSDLPAQRQAQETIANESYNQGINDLTGQKTSSLNELESTQDKTLNTLAEDIRNLFKAGSVTLGARGAGDSSAANQYSYAITKLGNKRRADVMSQVAMRRNQINDIFNQESNRLKSDLNTNIANITNWFASAQSQLKQQIAEAGLKKSADLNQLSSQLLAIGMQEAQRISAEYSNRRNQLNQWAMARSKDMTDLLNNMRQIDDFVPQIGSLQGLPPVNSQGGYGALPVGYGTNSSEKRDAFGRPIS